MGLEEELLILCQPAPAFQDPEDSPDDVTVAQLTEKEVVGDPQPQKSTQLRRQAALTLSETDDKYAGKTVSRKKLQRSFDTASADDDQEIATGLDDALSDAGDEEIADSCSEDSDFDNEIASFKSSLRIQSERKETLSPANHAEEESDLEVESAEEEEDYCEDETTEDEGDSNEDKETDGENNADQRENLKEDNDVKGFSSIEEDREKGRAAKAQIKLWDNLMEGRIKLQKLVALVNQLPQPATWSIFADKGDTFSATAVDCQNNIKSLLDTLINLQSTLLMKNGEVSGKSEEDDDITSDSETEKSEQLSRVIDTQAESCSRKRKLKEYSALLTKKHADFRSFRDNTIQKWNDRTRLASGKVSSKSFGAFESSALKQIAQIMHKKERLIKRTQMKRAVYRTLGQKTMDMEDELPQTEQAMVITHEPPVDPEIFDDTDYYQNLLRSLIETKAADDPFHLSRQWLEIQKLRRKMKRKVDTRASKGRKIRYDIHKKLVNFMAPVDKSTWSLESRNDLMQSLFR